jgi:hypothetical protein
MKALNIISTNRAQLEIDQGGHSYIETIVHWATDATRRKATAVLWDTKPGAGGTGRFTKSNTTKETRQMTLQVPPLVSLAQRDGSP